MVAAVLEIVVSTQHHVLICANSNTACDEITTRLIETLPDISIFRMYAKSFKETLNENIKKISNFTENGFEFPCLAYLYKYRVVVCTLFTAGNLVRARSNDENFDSSHFSHIIVDEAACTNEPTTMIPIAG